MASEHEEIRAGFVLRAFVTSAGHGEETRSASN